MLVFFATTGRANAAVLAELESEVRATASAASVALVSMDEVHGDLDRIAATTLPEMAAASASRMMKRWLAIAVDRMPLDDAPRGSDDLRA